MLEDGAAVLVSKVVGVGVLGSADTGTVGSLVAELERVSDRLDVKVPSEVDIEASGLDISVVMELTVAVIVSAILGIAPYTPSQTV